jgi:hypothetical protein
MARSPNCSAKLIPWILAAEVTLTKAPPHFVQLPALVKARQGATDEDHSSYLDDPSIKPNLGADAEY